jgi:predicted HTH domain antitoxin
MDVPMDAPRLFAGLYLDEDVSVRIAEILRGHGYDVHTPREEGMLGTTDAEDEIRRELALHLFEEDKLSFGKARELSGMSVWDFQQLLGSRGIPVHYSIE